MTAEHSNRNITVRALREAEVDNITRVWTEAGLPHRVRGRDSPEELRGQFMNSPDLFIGAFHGEEMIGVAIATDDGRKGWINRLAVVPGFRRMGVGKAIVEKCEEALRKRGRGVISILIEGTNEASESLFLRQGYRDERDIRYYTKRDSEDT